MQVKQKISALLEQLTKGIYEKDDVMKMALLSAVAGESIFLLGAPGVAKSLIARRLKFAFKEDGAFEYLMNRFSTPDEIFGPVDIKKLKDEGKYERIVKKYLPAATVVFLDEIWKASPSIQNTLLTVLNEKIYRNGEQEIPVPMKALISASNELPMKDSGLDALWDRFLVRMEVQGIQAKEKFNEMITLPLDPYQSTVKDELKISDEEYKQWSKAIEQVTMPENVLNVIHVIRGYIDQHNQKEENKNALIYISDRRWKKIARLLRTSAFLNDRKEVDLMDCFLIIPCIWNETKQIKVVEQFVKDAVEKHGYTKSIDLIPVREKIKELKDEIEVETKKITDSRVADLTKVYDRYYEVLNFKKQQNLILVKDYNSLGATDSTIRFYSRAEVLDATWVRPTSMMRASIMRQQQYNRYNSANTGSKESPVSYPTKIGKDKNHIVVDNTEYALKHKVRGEKVYKTTRPHKLLEQHWDSVISKILQETNDLRISLDKYRNNDLAHIRRNLFVDAQLAELVETQLMTTKTAIEKLEVDVREIQSGYKNLKDEEVVIK